VAAAWQHLAAFEPADTRNSVTVFRGTQVLLLGTHECFYESSACVKAGKLFWSVAPAGHVSQAAAMSDNVGLRQPQWIAVAAAAFATGYLIYSLVGLGADFQLTRQTLLADQVRFRHNAVCADLGKSPGSDEHDACMDALRDLKGWHHKVFLDENESLL
jgi:hypothetical protein